MTYPTILPRSAGVLEEVSHERARQDAKWGEQDHPNGTGPGVRIISGSAPTNFELAVAARARLERNAAKGKATYEQILTEEVLEAYAESDPTLLRAELIQVAAVAVAWVEKIDRDQKATR